MHLNLNTAKIRCCCWNRTDIGAEKAALCFCTLVPFSMFAWNPFSLSAAMLPDWKMHSMRAECRRRNFLFPWCQRRKPEAPACQVACFRFFIPNVKALKNDALIWTSLHDLTSPVCSGFICSLLETFIRNFSPIFFNLFWVE